LIICLSLQWLRVSTYQIFAFVALISQLFFGLRAWRLWHRSWIIAFIISLLAISSFVCLITWSSWAYMAPRFDAMTTGAELNRVIEWYEYFNPIKQGLQLSTGFTGLGEFYPSLGAD
jgi:hypothetical protein